MLEPTALVELVLRDNSGSRASIVMHVPNDTTVATASSAALALLAVAAPVSGAVIDTLRIRYRTKFDPTTPAAEGSSITRCGVFIFETLTGDDQQLTEVPAITDDILVTTEPGAGILIDTSNSDVVAFLAALDDAGDVNPFGVDCTELVAAYRQSRV